MLRICVLGELAIEAGDGAIELPESRRARLLLGWLALHPGLHARAELASRLRPDVLDESARSSLRQAAWALRPAVGDALIANRERIGLADDVWVDSREFDRLARDGAADEALALSRGPLLTGFDDEWVLDARDAQLHAEDRLMEGAESAAAARGDTAAALAVARHRAARDPLSEDAQRALMTRQAEAGDRAAALKTFERLSDRLRRELGVAPSPATRQLAARLREDAGETPQAPLPPRLAAAGRRPFVGRDQELQRAMDAWNGARDGSLHAVLLAGEPGIGKTRLAAEVASRAHAAGALVLHGRCSEEPLGPYQAWVEALAQASVPFDPAAEGARLELFRSVVESLGAIARARPLVLVLDDVHWADPPTLLLLLHLVGAAPSARILVIATFRDTEAGPGLQRTLADLRREPGVERVRVRGMGDADVAALVRTLAERAGADAEFDRAVSEETGGSPFFVQELIRHLEETGRPLEAASLAGAGLPEGVGEVLERRLELLGDQAREALTVAAVAGLEFRVDVVAAAAGMDERALGEVLDAAVAAGLATEPPAAPARYAFPHALVREALYTRAGSARRAGLHADVGRALESLSADPDADAAALALHFGAAGLPAEAVRHGEAAARAAMRMLAWEDAAAHVERALAAAGSLDAWQRCRLLLLLGEARGRAGAAEQAGESFAEVAKLARGLGSGELLAEAALGAGGVGVTILDVDAGLIALLEEALEALGDDSAALRARLLARLATELYYSGDDGRERGRELTAEAVRIAREADDAAALTETLNARRVALWDPRYLEERLEVDGELIALGARHREAELRGRHWRYVDLFEAGDVDEARAELDRYAALAAELRMPAFSWYVPLWRASLAIFEARYEDAQRLLEEAHAAGRRAEDANADVFRAIQEGGMTIDQELFAEFEIPEAMIERLESESASVAWMTGMAWAYAEKDRVEEGRGLLARVCADDLALLPWDANRIASLAELAEAALALDEPRFADSIERALEPWADRNLANARAVTAYGSGYHFLGRLAQLRGDTAKAARHFEAAVERNTAYGAVRRAAISQRELERVSASAIR